MEENINAYNKDDAYRTLELVNTWISNMDTKVSFALALIGVLVGIIFSAGLPNAFSRVKEVSQVSDINGGDIIAVIMVCTLYIISFISILYFMLAIKARVKNLNNAPSIFFFDSIGKMEVQDYMDKVKSMSEEDIIKDLEEQIHTNSRICSKKADYYNKGVRFLVATIILWFVCMTFRLI